MTTITMTQTKQGAGDPKGLSTAHYTRGETYEMAEPWQQALAAVFVAQGWATADAAPAEPKEERMIPGAPENKDSLAAEVGPPPGTTGWDGGPGGRFFTVDVNGERTGGPYSKAQLAAWGLRPLETDG